MEYTFDDVGNVLGYENKAWGHTTSQSYGYDSLYQLTSVSGNSKSHPYSPQGNIEYVTNYTQTFNFSIIGNMTSKVSTESVSNPNRIGADLNYNLDYAYYPGTHKAERIGSRYYDYDLNGNLSAEREGGHAVDSEVYRPYYQDGNLYWAEYGFGLVKPEGKKQDDGVYQRNYRWNERNLLSETSDSSYTVHYRYGADGQRALKFTANSGRSTVYFNKMWQTSDISADWLQGKHVYVGEDRIATKYNSEGNDNTQAERERTYYYHSDHLGSAQTVTNWKGQVHERLEYTPYGELWIDWKSADAPEDSTPFRFTGKEQDPETGLYYYGARYLDPKTSRWLSGDPALGEYLPSAPLGDEAKKRNQNLPGQGGVFNYVNLHVYHYAGNNPVKYVDPDGRNDEISHRETDKRFADWLRVCDPKYHIVAYDVKVYIENQATLGYRPIYAQLTQTAEEALLGRKIYAMAGIVFVGLSRPAIESAKKIGQKMVDNLKSPATFEEMEVNAKSFANVEKAFFDTASQKAVAEYKFLKDTFGLKPNGYGRFQVNDGALRNIIKAYWKKFINPN
jgi:RHS repeat-associated protein